MNNHPLLITVYFIVSGNQLQVLQYSDLPGRENQLTIPRAFQLPLQEVESSLKEGPVFLDLLDQPPEYVTADFWPWVSARLADLHWQGERGHGEWRDRRYYAREPRNIWEETLDRIEVINSMVWFWKRR